MLKHNTKKYSHFLQIFYIGEITMYKLIATDCDGTILDSQGYLPKEIIETFQKLHKKGIHIIVATGRSDILAKDYLDELDIDCPVIGCNGATLVNFYTGQNYFINAMAPKSLDSLYTLCNRHKTGVKIFTPDTCYASTKELYLGGINLITVKYTKKMKYSINYELAENMHSLLHLNNVIKAVVIDSNINTLLKIRDEINETIPGLKAVQSNWNCIDINAENVSKGNALLDYANMLGISSHDIIAFGDSENDVSMLKVAGLGVAVSNAADCAKEAADQITDTNDNFGVAKFLKSLYNI